MTDGQNEFHFQIFCDEANTRKLVGRTTGELNINESGRKDVVYGDIHFYLPAGTKFYEARPSANIATTTNLNEVHTSAVPLYASMSLSKGAGTMITRQACANAEGAFEPVGSPLVNADGKDYEYNLYKQPPHAIRKVRVPGMNCCALGALSTLNMKPWFLLMPPYG